jgi:hypothetical protein
MSSVAQLASLQQYLTSYGMTTYTILGNIGLLCNIAIFSQSAHRRNPSSLYILAASISGLIGLNISVVPVVYALKHPNPLTSSLMFCQLQFYVRHAFNQMMRSFFIFTCADRYAISSNNVRLRSFSRYTIALRTIVCVALFWFVLSIFPVMLRSLKNGKCESKNGVYTIVFSIYILVVLGIFPILSMAIFTLLLKINLKNRRRRIQPMANNSSTIHQHFHKRDRDMLRMLLIEFVCFMITTIPAWSFPLYKSATQNTIKSSDRQKIETFLLYFSNVFLLFINNGLSFWIYIYTSRSFRLEFRNLIIKSYRFITGKQVRTIEIN